MNIGSITGDFGKKVKKTEGIEILKKRDRNYFKYLKECSEDLLRNEEIIFKRAKIKDKNRLLGFFIKN